MKVQHYLPRNDILKEHIEYFYFLKTGSSDFETRYYAFPHTLTPVSIHQNVEAEIKHYSVSVFESKKKNNLAFVQGMRTRPLAVSLKGKLDKFTVCFKPLGLNNFVARSFSHICPNDTQIFREWDENPTYQEFLKKFYKTIDQTQRISILEDFLLSIYCPIENQLVLERAISILTDFEIEQSIEAIANSLGLNVRAFNRLFKKHLGISPIGYKKIARFRHSLNNKFFSEQFQRLTDIAYNSNFYDQSYFSNIYKEMTGTNPKSFFDEIEKVGDDRLLFQFLNK